MYGLLDEKPVPKDVTEVIIHPSDSSTTIKEFAFHGCRSLVRITMPDTVTHIEHYAFAGCDSLKYFQFSRNLVSIGRQAFWGCTSIQAIFLPPTVKHIYGGAFQLCESLRFFYVPEVIEHIGDRVVLGCDGLLTTVNYKFDYDDEVRYTMNNCEVNAWLMQRNSKFPLHRACSSTDVNPRGVEGCSQEHGIERATEIDDQQMMASHILCANPHVTGDCIRAYLALVPGAANEQDDTGTGMTGLHILCSLSRQDASTGYCIRAYLQLAPDAAEQEDSDGMTPFQHLCRNDVTFLDDRNFSSLMIWWYHCMPPQAETGKKRKRG